MIGTIIALESTIVNFTDIIVIALSHWLTFDVLRILILAIGCYSATVGICVIKVIQKVIFINDLHKCMHFALIRVEYAAE
jgi:hypothetical protein